MGKKENDKYTFGQFVKERKIVTAILIIIPIIGIGVFVPLLCCDKVQVNDLGSFLGGMLAYIGTVLLGSISVWQNEKFKIMSDEKDKAHETEIKESQRLSIQPYLFCEYEEVSFDVLSKMERVEYLFIDEFLNKKDGYAVRHALPSDLQRELNEDGKIVCVTNKQKYGLIKYSITNIGQAGAVDIMMEVNNRKTFAPFSMVKDVTKLFYILFEIDEQFEGKKEVVFSYSYYDIQGQTNYKQKFVIDIGRDIQGFVYTAQKRGITSPEFCEYTP